MTEKSYSWFHNPINSRYYLPNLLALMKLDGIGVEVGTAEGHFSEALLMRSSLEVLYSVDSWEHLPSEKYNDVANISQKEHDRNYLACKKRLKRFGKRSVIMKMTSLEASKVFVGDERFDLVYVDANHHREVVVQDLNIWYSKVKKGGIFAGHDYIEDGLYDLGRFGVKSAVDEFTYKHGEMLLVCEEETWPTWYFIKSG